MSTLVVVHAAQRGPGEGVLVLLLHAGGAAATSNGATSSIRMRLRVTSCPRRNGSPHCGGWFSAYVRGEGPG